MPEKNAASGTRPALDPGPPQPVPLSTAAGEPRRTEVSRKDRLLTLLLDELAYRIVHAISRRAQKRDPALRPLCVSTTDLIGHRLLATGTFERTQIEAIDALMRGDASLPGLSRRGDTFIDVGANIGYYTTRYASHFARTLAIEASPITFDILKGNIALTRSPNVIPVCAGASDRSGVLPLNMRTDGIMGWSSFGTSSPGQTFSIDVPLMTLDEIVGEHLAGYAVSVIKIDVEGHEAKVLRGARSTLARSKPVVLYEKLGRTDGGECKEILREAGYANFYRFSRRHAASALWSRSAVYAEEIDPAAPGHVALVCAF